MSALKKQVGGDHYSQMAIQPCEFIHANSIPFLEGTAISYLARWRSKGGIEDLRKARHTIDLLIELEGERPKKKKPARDTRQLDIEEWLAGAREPDRAEPQSG